jgi:hypothetical protein
MRTGIAKFKTLKNISDLPPFACVIEENVLSIFSILLILFP